MHVTSFMIMADEPCNSGHRKRPCGAYPALTAMSCPLTPEEEGTPASKAATSGTLRNDQKTPVMIL